MNCKLISTLIFSFMFSLMIGSHQSFGQTGKDAVLKVQKTTDFSVDGKGSADNWSKTDWKPIIQRATTERMSRNIAPVPTIKLQPEKLSTRVKVLYSDTGIYFLFECEDRVLQATKEEDFKELWWEDVVEIFLWPDENDGTYFEYQLSPLNYVRMTRHKRGASSEKHFVTQAANQKSHHKTSVEGGSKVSGASVINWSAEIYIPYQLLKPVNNTPEIDTKWRVNLYRFDYDTGDRVRWEWQPVDGRNHELELFGTFLFE